MRLARALVSLATAVLTVNASRHKAAQIPSFALQYAPVVYLYDQENYFPSDLGAQLRHTTPELDYAAINNAPAPTLNNLGQLNSRGGSDVYLTSKDDVTTSPSWLYGVQPSANGETEGAVSGVIIVVEKDNGVTDVFYMYFYAFNYGGDYFGLNVGNHVGDWEHNMIRFQNGKPQAVWYSQHSNGQAFHYAVLQKYGQGVRPITFSANGTHANYAGSGVHDHTVPGLDLRVGAISDKTSRGAMWDITRSAYQVKYDVKTQQFSAYDSSTPTSWLDFVGQWGDQIYPQDDPRQSCPGNINGLCKYQNGPTGPRDKQLDREDVCPSNGNPCVIQSSLIP